MFWVLGCRGVVRRVWDVLVDGEFGIYGLEMMVTILAGLALRG